MYLSGSSPPGSAQGQLFQNGPATYSLARGGELIIQLNFNSVNLIQPNITNYELASEGFTICTHTTSLTFDLTSDQEKLPTNRKKTFHWEKREETFRRATEEDPSLQDGHTQ